ncbi:unnamed protein product, partial [marine sediment metagenome]
KPTLIVPKVFIDDTEEFKKKVNLYFKTDMDKYPDEPLIESEKLLLKAVSLLPPPCERCGGSGRIPVEVRYISCAGGLDTKSKTLIPCPKCQAPAGKVEKFVLCKRCGNKTILATALTNCFDPADEPYRNGVQEECGYEDGIAAEVTVGIHWCPKCGIIEDVWIEEPMEKDVRDQELQAKIEQLKDGAFVANEEAQIRNDKIAQLEAENRWMPASDPPKEIDWDKKILVLECESEIPRIMTMAEAFLNECSEAEYYKFIPTKP